jgi:hypothetical protein
VQQFIYTRVYRIISYHIYHIISHIISYNIISYVSCHVMSRHVTSRHVMSRHISFHISYIDVIKIYMLLKATQSSHYLPNSWKWTKALVLLNTAAAPCSRQVMQFARCGTDFNELIFHRSNRDRGAIPPVVLPFAMDMLTPSPLRGHVVAGMKPFARWLWYHHKIIIMSSFHYL